MITSSAGSTVLAATPAGGSAGASGSSSDAWSVVVMGTPPASSGATNGVSGISVTFKQLTARGAIRVRRVLATFSLIVTAGRGGSLRFVDPSRRLTVRSTRILSILVNYGN